MDPKSIRDLAALPWTFHVVLASGYCAYLVAYVGIRYNHKATDTIFASLAFGLVALLALLLPLHAPVWVRASSAFVASIFAGILWRSVVRDILRRIASRLHYSWSDGTHSAWDKLQEDSRQQPTQLAVETSDGWTFYCTDAWRVKDLPFGPYVLGTNGDVLMYADRSEGPDKPEGQVPGVFDDQWGSQITYLPKDRVIRIMIRFISSAEEAHSEGWVQGVVGYLRRRLPR